MSVSLWWPGPEPGWPVLVVTIGLACMTSHQSHFIVINGRTSTLAKCWNGWGWQNTLEHACLYHGNSREWNWIQKRKLYLSYEFSLLIYICKGHWIFWLIKGTSSTIEIDLSLLYQINLQGMKIEKNQASHPSWWSIPFTLKLEQIWTLVADKIYEYAFFKYEHCCFKGHKLLVWYMNVDIFINLADILLVMEHPYLHGWLRWIMIKCRFDISIYGSCFSATVGTCRFTSHGRAWVI